MTVIDLFRMIRNNVPVLLLCTGIGLGVALVYTMVQPRLYTSSSTGFVVVTGTQADGGSTVLSGSDLAQQSAQSYLPLIHSRAVQEKIDELRGSSAAPGQLSASVAPNSNLITVSATAEDPQAAADLANTALNATADVANDLEGSSTVQVVALEDALVPAEPSSPNLARNLLYGAGIGLLAGLVISLLRRLLDVNVRTVGDAREASGTGLLGAVPEDPSLKQAGGPADLLAPRPREAVRQLRTNLTYVSIDNPPRVIAFTSANPGEGKSTVVSSLARALAEAGQRVILIDADLRRPRQAVLFQIEGRVGLSEVLAGQIAVEDAIQEVGEDGLVILPAGRTPPNPSELLGSGRMRSLLKELEKEFLVLIDAPPVLPVTDSTLLAAAVDGTVLVVRHGRTRKDHVEVAREMLDAVQANILGFVLNGTPAKGVGHDYYGGGYGSSSKAYAAYLERPGDDLEATDTEKRETTGDTLPTRRESVRRGQGR